MTDEVDQILIAAAERFRAIEGIVSVDYARVDDHPDMYLVIFRYVSKQFREEFQETEELRSTMAQLRQVWDLESPIFRGETFV